MLELDLSTLLKSDQWLSESQRVSQSIRGVTNFRSIPGTNIYACGQPTESAIHQVAQLIKERHPNANKVVWVTLREEPIVYINGAPYCLRRERFSLRNMKGLWFSYLQVPSFYLFQYRLRRNFCLTLRNTRRTPQR